MTLNVGNEVVNVYGDLANLIKTNTSRLGEAAALFSKAASLEVKRSKIAYWYACTFNLSMLYICLASFPGSLPLHIFTRVQEFQHVIYEPARPLKFGAGSKVTRWNSCTRVNIRKGREPGNEANICPQNYLAQNQYNVIHKFSNCVLVCMHVHVQLYLCYTFRRTCPQNSLYIQRKIIAQNHYSHYYTKNHYNHYYTN